MKPGIRPERAFADHIRGRRKELGYTLEKLASAAECSIPYISEMERGVKAPPSPAVIEKLAVVLQSDPVELAHLAEVSRRSVEIDLDGKGVTQRELAVLLARRFDEGLSDEEAARLLNTVKNGFVDE